MLQVRGLRVTLDSLPVVWDVSFDLPAGSITGLCGQSGCGKTTLALALLNLLPAETGVVEFEGRNLLALSERELESVRGGRIALMFQDPLLSLNPVMRAGKQIAEVARAHGIAQPRVAEALGLTPRHLEAYPHQLSGGERQRVALAQALAAEPALVIADEPFTALDAARVAELASLFRKLRDTTGTSFLIIAHDMAVLEALADTVLVMHAGRIEVGGKVARAEVGRASRAANAPTGEPLLRVRNLCKSYRKQAALAGISFDLQKGRTLGLVGLSGAGKSTLARCLAGHEPPDSGEVLLEGRTRWPRQEVQLIRQQPAASLNPRFTAEEIIAEPLAIQGCGDRESRRDRARQLMATVRLDPSAAGKRAHQFSGGERQRLAIARSLALEPKVLILDESLVGLDSETQEQIASLLRELQHERGLTYILISHDRALVERMAGEIRTIEQGVLV